MRIGMILDKPFPPDPRVENEATTLVSQGHDVFLFCLRYHDDEATHEIINGINICRYLSNKLEYKLSALVYTIPFYTNIMAKKISHFVKEQNIEILHIHDLQIAGAAFRAIENHQIKTVLDLHENRPEIMKFYTHLQGFPGKYLIQPKTWKQKEEIYCKKATKVVLVTKEAKKELCARVDIVEKNVVVVPNTVRSSFFKEKVLTLDLEEKYKKSFVLLYIGDTGLRRGLLTAIEAVSILKNKIENIKLVIVGSSKTDTLLKVKVEELGVAKFVDFEGWKNEKLLSSYIKASNVCISPLHRNIHHDTTYANKVFQYLSFSKPVLVSNATAQKNIVEANNAGLVHKDRDVKDFVEKTLQLYNCKDLQNELGKNGKQFIESEFVWEKTSQDLVKMYNQLAK